MNMLDDVFELLETAKRLEKSGGNRIEAATKYYEAVYLMRQAIQHTPQNEQGMATIGILEDNIQLYSAAASRLYFDESSIAPSTHPRNDPRSPMSQDTFFTEQSVPPPPPSYKESPRFVQTAEVNQKAGQANAKLSKAIQLDESGDIQQAMDTYLASAEMYLEAIRICERRPVATSSILSVLKRRLEGAMDRIEQLKRPKKRLVQEQKHKHMDTKKKPSLTPEEIAILKRSSTIASGLFLPWLEEDGRALSQHVQKLNARPRTFFVDKEGDLELSDKQKKKFYKWARPSEIAQMRQRFGTKQSAPTMIQSINPYSIRQQYVTDCSFIASLCICAAFEKRLGKRLITSIIYPQNKQGVPIYNPEGKYMVKLWLNGVARKVVVDDKLPIDRNSNLLCSHTTGDRNQLELWVSVVEKAYMKLCGGYDFPGSNSGVDLFSLTGWIPERIFLAQDPQKVRDYETAPERAWERLFSANSFGDCLITVSTTRDMSEGQAASLGLVTGHAYAVLDVFQGSTGVRLLQLKNPWASKGWTGKYSPYDGGGWTSSLRSETGYNPELAAKHDDGIFWICWEDVLRFFRNIHLSWNPALFSTHVTTHGFWPKDQGPANDTFNVGENPQYVMSLSDEAIKKQSSIWVLISRHVTKQEQEGAEVNDFLTIHVLRNSKTKERMWHPHGPHSLINGAYTNNPHVLVRYDVSGPRDKYISLVLSQHQKSQDMGYTLSCFCTEPFSLGQPQKKLPLLQEVSGSWNQKTAGGPVGKDGFFRNPMFFIDLQKETQLQLMCSTARTYAVNVMLISIPPDSNDYRNVSRKHGRPFIDSGNYRHGFTVTDRTTVPPGCYTLVVSTYNPGQFGVFNLKVASSSKLSVSRIG